MQNDAFLCIISNNIFSASQFFMKGSRSLLFFCFQFKTGLVFTVLCIINASNQCGI